MEKPAANRSIPGSFRDPSGFVFTRDGVLYRQVNKAGQADYDQLMGLAPDSVRPGLYHALADVGMLIPHEEVDLPAPASETAYKVLKPRFVPFMSYPYEWSFSQLKDAALLTLAIQNRAMEFGMTLKDSSAYNIQFLDGTPVLIDTLSFEKYKEGEPWVAYRQFCQHFLAPLALMSHRDVRLSQLLRVFIDGIPLDLASSLLPSGTKFSLALGTHIHLHARSQRRYADKTVKPGGRKVSRTALLGVISNLGSGVRKLGWKPKGTEWAEYYDETNYSSQAFQRKRALVAGYLERTGPNLVWDLGANTGVFSRLAADKGIRTVSFDVDPAAVEKNYLDCRERGETNILPLVLDLTNPSPAIGWENRERLSLLERGPADTVLALALIHHLAIGNNLPLPKVARFFSRICSRLVIEFVPKMDSQVQRLLATREDIFPDYTQGAFEEHFRRFFEIAAQDGIEGSERTLYLMARRGGGS